ncbi:MAG TPA: alpha/beta fold hydrolase [Pseudonocardia sp.]|nr:alpha/beta fold hydrolase [Pseudonocardia sp.]
MSTVVLVPGACHGGWWYEPLVQRLAELGHRATAVTLAGVSERADELTGRVNLDSHVAEIVELVTAAAEPVVLVGHSYAGSVISGVADRIPERIAALLYLDAFVPEDGDSCWTMTNDIQRRWYIDDAGDTGLAVNPLPFFDARASAHPLAAFVQRSRLTGAWRTVPVKHYALAAAPEWLASSPFLPTADRLRPDPGWTVHDLPITHNVLSTGPDLVLDLLRPII